MTARAPANKGGERGRNPVLAALAQVLAGYRQDRCAARGPIRIR